MNEYVRQNMGTDISQSNILYQTRTFGEAGVSNIQQHHQPNRPSGRTAGARKKRETTDRCAANFI